MHGLAKKEKTEERVRAYLKRAIEQPAEKAPINYSEISRRTEIDRRTVKKWMRSEIEQAQREQTRNSGELSPRERDAQLFRDKLRSRDQQIGKMETVIGNLRERLLLVEANAQRLGINPDELYSPIRRPDRSVSRAGRGTGRGRN